MHGAWKRETLKVMNVSLRWDRSKQLNLCFRCLGYGHSGKNMCAKPPVRGQRVQSKSHRLLHQDRPTLPSSSRRPTQQPPATPSPPATPTEGEGSTATALTTTMKSTVNSSAHLMTLRTVPVIVKNGNKKIRINALLDDASTTSYLNADIAVELGLQSKIEKVTVN